MNRNGQITTHTFYTQGGRVVGETRRNPNGSIDRLEFIYDESGRPIQMIFNGAVYNYVLNLQGDVQQIRRASDGAIVATYLYNAWGEILSMSGTRAATNPLRYRGKFFCLSTGFYYLNSRFYDPVIGRFINWDAFVGTGQGELGYNMFAYCLNNPVNRVDPTGYRSTISTSMAHWHLKDAWAHNLMGNPDKAKRARRRAAVAQRTGHTTHHVDAGIMPIFRGGDWVLDVTDAVTTAMHNTIAARRVADATSRNGVRAGARAANGASRYLWSQTRTLLWRDITRPNSSFVVRNTLAAIGQQTASNQARNFMGGR